MLKSQKRWVKMGSSRLVDFEKLKYGPGTLDDAVPSALGFAVGGQSYFNFLASMRAFAQHGSGLAGKSRSLAC